MKKEKATIKLVLRTNKVLANGEHPIMLRVNWQGKRAEKSTGFSCREQNWSSSSECIKLVGKDIVPNVKTINATIQNLKNDANEILNKFLYEGRDYSAQMIIDYLESDTCFEEIDKRKIEYEKLNDESDGIYSLISDNPISIDQIAKKSELSISAIMERLLILEINGVIKKIPGEKYILNY